MGKENTNLLKTLVLKLLNITLSHPRIFEWQQKLCNDYSSIGKEFSGELAGAGKAILDVGCAGGTCSGQIIDMKKNRFIGIDVEARYIERAAKQYPDGKFLSMDGRKLAFENNSFDVVLFVGVLHHMNDELIHDCLKEIHRVVRPEGVVLITEPLFTKGCWLSNLLLSFDRGRFIRKKEEYQSLLMNFNIAREGYFEFSRHRMCSFVLKKADH